MIVVRGGVIEAVGPVGTTAIPSDAQVIDVKGKTLHAAYVDPYVSVDRLAGKGPKQASGREESGESTRRSRRSAGPATHTAAAARAEERVIDTLVVKEDVAEEYRRLGFAVAAAVPAAGVLRGSGAVVSLADGSIPGRIVDAADGQYVALEPDADATEYPVSKMGAAP